MEFGLENNLESSRKRDLSLDGSESPDDAISSKKTKFTSPTIESEQKREIITDTEKNNQSNLYMIIDQIAFEKTKTTASYSFKIGYVSRLISFETDDIITISIGYASSDKFLSLEKIKHFVDMLEKDKTCRIHLNANLKLSYNHDSKNLLHDHDDNDSSRYPGVIFLLNKESRENIVQAFKLYVIDKINQYMDL